MNWCWRLLPYGRRHSREFVVLLAVTCVAVLFSLLKPWPLKLIVDSVLKDHPLPPAAGSIATGLGATSPQSLLGWLVGLTVLVFVLRWAAGVLQAYLQMRAGRAIVYDLAGDLFRRLQELGLPFHTRRKTGDLVKRVTADCGCGRDLFMNVLFPCITSILTLLGMLVILWQLDPTLAMLSLAVLPFLALAIWLSAKQMTSRSYEQFNAQGEHAALANDVLGAMPLVRTFCRGDDESRRYQTLAAEADVAGLRATVAQLRFKLSVAAVTSAGIAVIIAIGGAQVLQGKITIGSLMVFLSYLNSVYGPLETLAYLSSGWATAAAGAQRVFEVFDSPDRIVESKHPQTFSVPPGKGVDIQFVNVTFGYDQKEPILRDVSFHINAGETVAIVGPSGAGKTALASLIPRLFDPWEGKILMNGIDIRELRVADLRKHISIVLQDDFILPLTVSENIAYGRPDASEEEIRKAAQAAHADVFIRRLPQGYNTVLGERGANLSGGERQRLSIARAFLKSSPLLIMDEPTSALDSETELTLMGHLDGLSRTRTVFLIAHRLSTIRHADRILVFDRGSIVEAGTHRELIDLRGAYAHLHELQAASRKTSTVLAA